MNQASIDLVVARLASDLERNIRNARGIIREHDPSFDFSQEIVDALHKSLEPTARALLDEALSSLVVSEVFRKIDREQLR